MQLRELHFYPSMPYDNVLDTNSIDRAKMEFGGHSGFSVIVDGRKLPTFLVLPLPFLLVFWGCAIYNCVVLLRDTLISTVSNPWAQILICQSISSSPTFRHFYQVNFSRQNIVNRKDEVGLDIRFSGVQNIHMQMRIWKRLWWLWHSYWLIQGIFMNRNRLAL